MYVPKDRVTNSHQGYGFVEFRSEEDADYVSVLDTLFLHSPSGIFCEFLFTYSWKQTFDCQFVCLFLKPLQAIKVLNMIKLYGKPIRVNKV